MTAKPARFQHPGALKEAQRLIKDALDTGATHLNLSGLRLRYLPEELESLAKQLTHLDLSQCTVLTNLNGVTQLTELAELNISECYSLGNLPKLDPLSNLSRLSISGCRGLNSYGELKVLIQLKELNLGLHRNVDNIEDVLALTRLEVLELNVCPGLISLAGIEKLKHLKVLSIHGCEALTSLSGVERLTELASIEISWCPKLTSLAEIKSQTQLTKLSISDVKYLTNLHDFASLSELKILDISECGALTSLAGIEKLTKLHQLDIFDCDSLNCVAGIESLINLTRLNLHVSKVKSLIEIENLTQLNELYVVFDTNLIGKLNIGHLNKLRKLSLSGGITLQSVIPARHFTSLTELVIFEDSSLTDLFSLAFFPQLIKLTIGVCNKLTSLAGLDKLSQLVELNIFACDSLTSSVGIEHNKQLIKLSISECDALAGNLNVGNHKKLQVLEVSWCQKLINIFGLENLKDLNQLEFNICNELTELPDLSGITSLKDLTIVSPKSLIDCNQLQSLRNLKRLSVGNHQPISISLAEEWLLQKPYFHLRAYARGSLNICHMPPELSADFSQTAFEDWWFAGQQTGFAPVKQLKVMILGNGRIGKTQLARRLKGEAFDSSVPSTHGIQLHTISWAQLFGRYGSLPPAIDPVYADIQLHCWDFGGQDVYLGTHSLFLDDQAVYLLLWHPDAENNNEVDCESLRIRNRPLSYWLAYLKSLVGDNANILVCQSQCDEPTQHCNAPVPNPPPFKALRQLDISSKTNDGLEQFYPAFKKALQQQLQSNGEVWLPNSWLAVEHDIRQLIAEQPELKQLTYENFVILCNQHQVTAPATLANYLHQSGVLFYRPGHFNSQLILDQKWALQGVYLLLERDHVLPQLQASKGRFDIAMLERWLERQQLDSADLSLFLGMMQQCGACFEVNETHFITPDNLPEFDKNKAIHIWHDAEPDIDIELSYSFLHDATMRYLLSKIGEVAKEHAYYWRYGCCFYVQKYKTKAWFECRLLSPNTEHQQNYSQPGLIKLRFSGQQCAELAQHLVKSITQSSHLGQLPEVKWLKGQPVKNTDDKTEYDSPTPFSAIGPAALPPKTPAIYFSYAWGTEQDPRQKLCDEVYQCLKTEGYLVQRDKEATGIGASIAEFERRIGRGDFVLVVLSHKYLFESLHCMKELALLYESSQRQQPEFTHRIIPILLSDIRIDKPVDRLKIAKYWHEQHLELNNLVTEVGAEVAGASSALELEQMRSVVNCCVNALAWISDLITERQSELQVDATVTLIKTKIANWTEQH